jgi:hypothetical protein
MSNGNSCDKNLQGNKGSEAKRRAEPPVPEEVRRQF